MKEILISVIMSTYNEELDWIKESVDSILNQSCKNFEFVIIIDNPKRKDIMDYLEARRREDSRIVLEINERNLGLIKCLNKAIKLCNGKYIARMDADDISLPNRFEKQLDYIQSRKLDIIGANAILFNKNGIIEETNKLVNHKYIELYTHYVSPAIIHPTFFGSRKVFMDCMYNELALYAEDYEFLTHALALGYKLGNMPDTLLKIRYREGSVTSTKSYQSFLIAKSIRHCYDRFKKTGVYAYDADSIKKAWIDKTKEDRFIKKTIFLRNAKQSYNESRYISFVLNLCKAILKSRTSINSILDMIYLKYLKKRERKLI